MGLGMGLKAPDLRLDFRSVSLGPIGAPGSSTNFDLAGGSTNSCYRGGPGAVFSLTLSSICAWRPRGCPVPFRRHFDNLLGPVQNSPQGASSTGDPSGGWRAFIEQFFNALTLPSVDRELLMKSHRKTWPDLYGHLCKTFHSWRCPQLPPKMSNVHPGEGARWSGPGTWGPCHHQHWAIGTSRQSSN